MPLYNKEAYVAEAIESVLGQTLQDFELIIVDDKSTDSSRSIASDYSKRDHRIRLLKHTTNLGPSAAANTGIRSSRADKIAMIDADDLYCPSALETEYSSVPAGEETIVWCNAQKFSPEKVFGVTEQANIHDGMIFEDLLENKFLIDATWMIPKTCFNRVGLFDEKLRYDQVYDMSVRLARIFPFRHIPQSLYRYRIYSGNAEKLMKRNEFYSYRASAIEKHLKLFGKDLNANTRRVLLRRLYSYCLGSGQYTRIMKRSLSSIEGFQCLIALPMKGKERRKASRSL
jgi:glycosyltransferase involved in cell wall biosynthesis